MRLAPKQLRRAGMTGDVPYYGGRLTPWQIQGLTDTAAQAPASPAPASHLSPSHPLPSAQHGPSANEAMAALDVLLRSGVISPDEARALRGRIIR